MGADASGSYDDRSALGSPVQNVKVQFAQKLRVASAGCVSRYSGIKNVARDDQCIDALRYDRLAEPLKKKRVLRCSGILLQFSV